MTFDAVRAKLIRSDKAAKFILMSHSYHAPAARSSGSRATTLLIGKQSQKHGESGRKRIVPLGHAN